MIINLNQKGTAITEIGCIIALILVAAVISLGFIGDSVKNKFTSTANDLDENNGAHNGMAAGLPPNGDDNMPRGDLGGAGNQYPPSGSNSSDGYNSSSGPLGGYKQGLGGGIN